jgi:hypothetical protein
LGLQALGQSCDVALQVLEGALQRELLHHLAQRLRQRLARRVEGQVGRARSRVLVLYVFRADGRPHEDEVVVEVRAVQDLGGDRVEEGLGQLGLQMVDHEPDVVALDLLPDRHGLGAGRKFLFQPPHAFAHTQVVELDALALGALLAQPVGRLEAVLGTCRLGAEQAVMAVEAVHHRPRDVVGQQGVLGRHGHGASRVAAGPCAQSRSRLATSSTAWA